MCWLPAAQVPDVQQSVVVRREVPVELQRVAPPSQSEDPSELQRRCVSRGPRQPMRTEHEANEVSGYVPYRCWCDFCVVVRGGGSQHRRRGEGTRREGADARWTTVASTTKMALATRGIGRSLC